MDQCFTPNLQGEVIKLLAKLVVFFLLGIISQCINFTPNLFYVWMQLKENFVRVKTAAILVLGLYNDMWTFIEEEAKNFWALIAS
jgi:hypothetical protein